MPVVWNHLEFCFSFCRSLSHPPHPSAAWVLPSVITLVFRLGWDWRGGEWEWRKLGQASLEPQIYRIQQTGFDKFAWVPCWHRKSQGEWHSSENANENLIVMTRWLPTWRLVCWTLYIYHGSRGAVRQRPELEEGRGGGILTRSFRRLNNTTLSVFSLFLNAVILWSF